jgi:hypothetical protein
MPFSLAGNNLLKSFSKPRQMQFVYMGFILPDEVNHVGRYRIAVQVALEIRIDFVPGNRCHGPILGRFAENIVFAVSGYARNFVKIKFR